MFIDGAWPEAFTANVCVNGMAAAKFVLSPACEAVMVQAPLPTNVGFVPLTVQTDEDAGLAVNAIG